MHIGINIANHRDLLSKRYIHDTARMAEDLGFDSVWIPDHTVVPRAVEARYGPVYYDAVAVLAYLAGITSRVRLGTTVLVMPYRHPVVPGRVPAKGGGIAPAPLAGTREVECIDGGYSDKALDAALSRRDNYPIPASESMPYMRVQRTAQVPSPPLNPLDRSAATSPLHPHRRV